MFIKSHYLQLTKDPKVNRSQKLKLIAGDIQTLSQIVGYFWRNGLTIQLLPFKKKIWNLLLNYCSVIEAMIC